MRVFVEQSRKQGKMLKEATRRVLEARGSVDVPGFEACVAAELDSMNCEHREKGLGK